MEKKNLLKTDSPTFALLTDFGFDFAVASMKGLILKDFPNAQLVDIDHNIKHFSILSGAFVINKVYKYFPQNTIFICIIDPGVGSKREPIYLDLGDYKFIGPNNGLFHYILEGDEATPKSFVIKSDFKPNSSNTFHGRDLFTPAAIEIAKGNLDILYPIDTKILVRLLDLKSKNSVVTYVDGFGNIKTNISADINLKTKSFLKLNINSSTHQVRVGSTFSDVMSGELLCYQGSNGTLEIAANLTSAAEILKVKVGDRVSVAE